MSSEVTQCAGLLDPKEIEKILVAVQDRRGFLNRIHILLSAEYQNYSTEDFNNVGETPQAIEHPEIETILYQYAHHILALLEKQCGETPTMVRVPYFILHQILNIIIVEHAIQLRSRPETGAIEVCVSTGRKKHSKNFPVQGPNIGTALQRGLIFRQTARKMRKKQQKEYRIKNNVFTPARKKQVDYYLEQGLLIKRGGRIQLNGIRIADDPENFEKLIHIGIGGQSTSLLIDKEITHKYDEPTIRDFSATMREAIDKLCFFLGIGRLPKKTKDFLVERFGSESYYRS